AIDPELIDTVAVMAQGAYQVAGGRPGSGGRDAAQWLQLLTAMLKGRCTMALPFADVDQVALSRAGLTDLQGRARSDGEQILIDTLGVQPISDLVWPAGELIDERTLTDLASLGDTAFLLDPAGLADPGAAIDRPTVGLRTGSPATAGLRGVPVDALVGSALEGSVPDGSAAGQPAPGTGSASVPASVPASTAVPAGTERPLSTHEGAATLAWRVMAGSTAAGVLVTPPRRWAATGAETGELLRTAGELVAAGFAQPRDLERLATAEVPAAVTALTALTTTVQYPMRAGAGEVVRSITTDVTAVRNQLRDMDAATDRDPRTNVDPASLLDPLRYNLLRATSSAWRADQGGDGAAGQRFAADASWRLTALRQRVQIEPPAGPYLLAASDAPLLLTLNNPLLVQIDVQISLSEVQGLRTGAIDVVQVPAASRRQVRIPTEVIRAGQFSVEAQLSTPGGTPLGPPAASRIQLRSTAYGTVTLALTGGGAILLVLLAGLRITRRVRAARKATP
ncbi:MAG TPA: DUF6049 family protein, partial [Pseudonocardiaceae bacterium]|nr:DUF6049 family protein [Pseudonocardiaceae bacterium]